MRCAVCSKPEEETELFEGISIGEMIMVCKSCAKEGAVPIIKKPSIHQLEKADERHSVRERMERLSGVRETTPLSSEGSSSQSLRSRLREPPKKEHNEKVSKNYYWDLTIARRRRKMTLNQVSKATGINQELIASVERGRIPDNFEEVFPILEDYFQISLLTKRPSKINFIRRGDHEKEILEAVKERMNRGGQDSEDRIPSEDISIDKLIEKKRERDKKKKESQEKEKEDSMIGDDLEIDPSDV